MILNIKKPRGLTSHDVVNKVRSVTGEKRVGHGGTLDPFAEGVLVVGVGRESTKMLRSILTGAEKEYEATLLLGSTSTTGDPEGIIQTQVSLADIRCLTKERIKKTLASFIGDITQTPPPYSAVKIHGVPAHRRTRRGEQVHITPRTVHIHSIDIVNFRPPYLTIRATVSSGTYIRKLAEDIGKALGVGAYVTKLTRLRVGQYRISESIALDKLKSYLQERYNR